MVRAAVVGAAGYAGVELTRLLLGHPGFELTMVTSAQDEGRLVRDVYPALAACELQYGPHDAVAVARAADVAFLAVPHTAAMAVVPELLAAGLTVVDASADFRLHDAALFAKWYGVPHTAPELLDEAVYGLPELWRDRLPRARLIACPGCYPTAALLALAPALSAGVHASARFVVDALSGVSGAGRTPNAGSHYVAANESAAAYKVAVHRHTPEIAQGIEDLGVADPKLVFTPHLVPMSRGILATAYIDVQPGLSPEEAHAAYAHRYAEEPFVTVHPLGVHPATAEVRGSNRAHIGVSLDEAAGVLVVTCAIDNLVKGTSGQAIQCANISLGMDETVGLDSPGPVV